MRWQSEDRWVIGSMLLTLGGLVTAAWRSRPSLFGITAVVVFSLLLIGWRMTRSPRLGWLLLCGLVVGVLELWADWLHVMYFQSLVYTDYFGFRVLASPSYMPLGWCLTVVQFGYLALRIRERVTAGVAVGLVSLLGLAVPPWYEELAARAGAWHYRPGGWTIGYTPVWVILTYGAGAFAIATIAVHWYRPGGSARAALAGVLVAASLTFASVFWYAVLGRT